MRAQRPLHSLCPRARVYVLNVSLAGKRNAIKSAIVSVYLSRERYLGDGAADRRGSQSLRDGRSSGQVFFPFGGDIFIKGVLKCGVKTGLQVDHLWPLRHRFCHCIVTVSVSRTARCSGVSSR